MDAYLDAYMVSGGIIAGEEQETAQNVVNLLNNEVDDNGFVDVARQVISISDAIDNITNKITAAIAQGRLTKSANANRRLTNSANANRRLTKSANANGGLPPPRRKVRRLVPNISLPQRMQLETPPNNSSPQPMLQEKPPNSANSFRPGTSKRDSSFRPRTPTRDSKKTKT
jgi:hypothetical protein